MRKLILCTNGKMTKAQFHLTSHNSLKQKKKGLDENLNIHFQLHINQTMNMDSCHSDDFEQ